MQKTIHFIGCEGVSMKMLKALVEKEGAKVTGSDISLSGHNAENVDGADIVVYSAAIPPTNVEIVRAKELGLPLLSRSQMLGQIASEYDFSVAVAGAHGKTTTTAMLWETLLPFDPTIHIGGNYNGNMGRIGGKNLFVTEACEYKRSFLSLFPDIAIILNVDLDHTDCYKDISEMRESFQQFASQAKKLVIINGDEFNHIDADGNMQTKNYPRYISVGFGKNNDFYPTCIMPDKRGRYSFCVHHKGRRLGRVSLGVSGRHNIYNALFTIAACHFLNVSFGRISAGLMRFSGAERRMQLLGYKEGSAVFSDYAHHPSEIAMSLLSVRESSYKHVCVVFEPHTFTRTQSFFSEFIEALSKADSIVLLPIYAAREQPIEGVSSDELAKGLQEMGKNAVYLQDYDRAMDYISGQLHDDGVILFMGAGSIDTLAHRFMNTEIGKTNTL
jgi:UDP-N-acetylmuramate--alanine ligase